MGETMTSTMELINKVHHMNHLLDKDYLETRAILEQRIKELEADAARGRHLLENGCWHRSEDQTHLAVLVPHGSDLSCYAMRVVAIDRAMSKSALDKMREISEELKLP